MQEWGQVPPKLRLQENSGFHVAWALPSFAPMEARHHTVSHSLEMPIGWETERGHWQIAKSQRHWGPQSNSSSGSNQQSQWAWKQTLSQSFRWDHIPAWQHYCGFVETLRAEAPNYITPGFLKHRNVCCFNRLSFGVIYYITLGNKYIPPPWILTFKKYPPNYAGIKWPNIFNLLLNGSETIISTYMKVYKDICNNKQMGKM